MDEKAPKLRFWWFVLATFAGFGPTAVLFWPLTYTEYLQSNSLILPWVGAIGIASAVVAAFAERAHRSGPGILLLTPWVGVGTILATLGRVAFDVRLDPTSHNLWPFEVVMMLVFSLIPGLFGVLVGRGVGRLLATGKTTE